MNVLCVSVLLKQRFLAQCMRKIAFNYDLMNCTIPDTLRYKKVLNQIWTHLFTNTSVSFVDVFFPLVWKKISRKDGWKYENWTRVWQNPDVFHLLSPLKWTTESSALNLTCCQRRVSHLCLESSFILLRAIVLCATEKPHEKSCYVIFGTLEGHECSAFSPWRSTCHCLAC